MILACHGNGGQCRVLLRTANDKIRHLKMLIRPVDELLLNTVTDFLVPWVGKKGAILLSLSGLLIMATAARCRPLC